MKDTGKMVSTLVPGQGKIQPLTYMMVSFFPVYKVATNLKKVLCISLLYSLSLSSAQSTLGNLYVPNWGNGTLPEEEVNQK